MSDFQASDRLSREVVLVPNGHLKTFRTPLRQKQGIQHLTSNMFALETLPFPVYPEQPGMGAGAAGRTCCCCPAAGVGDTGQSTG